MLQAGGDDIRQDGDNWEIFTSTESLVPVTEALQAASITPQTSSIEMIPSNSVNCDAEQAAKVLGMFEALEEHDDVQNVWANFEIDDKILAARG